MRIKYGCTVLCSALSNVIVHTLLSTLYACATRERIFQWNVTLCVDWFYYTHTHTDTVKSRMHFNKIHSNERSLLFTNINQWRKKSMTWTWHVFLPLSTFSIYHRAAMDKLHTNVNLILVVVSLSSALSVYRIHSLGRCVSHKHRMRSEQTERKDRIKIGKIHKQKNFHRSNFFLTCVMYVYVYSVHSVLD